MRLGKEQAVGYVEDTEAESLPGTEAAPTAAAQRDGALAPAAEPALTTR
jgi:hypothetical protein